MKTPAITASLTIVGSITYAAGQGGAGKQSPVTPGGAQAHSMQEALPVEQLQPVSRADCPQSEALNWFSPEPHLVACAGGGASSQDYLLRASGGGMVDVNGDGILEGFGSMNDYNDVLINGVPVGNTMRIYVDRVMVVAGATTIARDTVAVIPGSFGAWAASQFGSPWVSACVGNCSGDGSNGYRSGWRDMDGDGDMDYLVTVAHGTLDGPPPQCAQVWFENVGFEKPSTSVAADLNKDGQVNGADLGLLLGAWGPNP